MTEFEQRLDTLIAMLADPDVTINQSGFTKIKENLLASAKEELWHDAQGDNLPEIDREVIVLCKNGKVGFGHRPDPNGWNGRNILTNEITHYIPQTYDKGGWNFPDIEWWLDLELPIPLL